MAEDRNTHVFRGKTRADAMAQAKTVLGNNINVLNIKQVRPKNLFDRLKLGGDSIAVELEVRVPNPDEKPAPAAPKPAGPSHALAKTYNLAQQGRENMIQKRPQDAGVTASIGSAGIGLDRRLSQMEKLLKDFARQNNAREQNMMSMISLQARGGMPLAAPTLLARWNALLDAGINEETARSLLEEAERANPGITDEAEAAQALRAVIAGRIPCAGGLLPKQNGRAAVIAFVGPSGVGKSSCLFKLALRHFREMRVAIINEDIQRPAAQHQFDNVGRLFGLPLVKASAPDEIADAVRDLQEYDLILIDTAGRSPRDKKAIAGLGALLKTAGADEIHLHLSGVSSEHAMRTCLVNFRPTHYNRIVFTKLDESTSFGALINVSHLFDQGLSYLTTGPDSIPHIQDADSAYIADLVLGEREVRISRNKEAEA